jgi:hypothetical protein
VPTNPGTQVNTYNPNQAAPPPRNTNVQGSPGNPQLNVPPRPYYGEIKRDLPYTVNPTMPTNPNPPPPPPVARPRPSAIPPPPAPGGMRPPPPPPGG